MQTRLDCLVCFMRQALAAARLSSNNPDMHRHIVDRVGRMLTHIPLAKSPPENAVDMYRMIADLSGTQDPFADLKKQSNDFALSIRDLVSEKIAESDDPLRTAVRFAVCGNIIDYAAQHSFNVTSAMDDCEKHPFLVDDYSKLLARLQDIRQAKVLYLADNCGEIVFDGLLVGELQRLGCEVTLAVRGAPIINDATMEDAEVCGLTSLCRVIDNGTDCPGTPLADCSAAFQQIFADADIILSKGMGNFETLSEVSAPLFFLFMVKCERVASHLQEVTGKSRNEITGNGEMILMQQERP